MFKNNVLSLKAPTKATKRKIFAETEAEMRGFSFYKFSEGTLYLLTNYSAIGIQKIVMLIGSLWPEYKMVYEYQQN